LLQPGTTTSGTTTTNCRGSSPARTEATDSLRLQISLDSDQACSDEQYAENGLIHDKNLLQRLS
jgi:hypothetical protein